VKSIVIC